MKSITNTELTVYLLYNSNVPLSARDIYNIAEKQKKNISLSVISSFLARSSNNPKIANAYKSKNALFKKVSSDSYNKYELINKNDKRVLKFVESYNSKIKNNVEDKVKIIINLGLDLKPSNDEIDQISKLFIAMKK